ncbi:MAG: hypothetical protein M3Q68_10270, partial [Actinomycetota bacterium]|nr:hypothetical protein [Actinomycetota bacterium]
DGLLLDDLLGAAFQQGAGLHLLGLAEEPASVDEGAHHRDQQQGDGQVEDHVVRQRREAEGATDPPTFTLFTNRPLPATYLRYLERKIREHFEFGPTPLKLRVRQRSG